MMRVVCVDDRVPDGGLGARRLVSFLGSRRGAHAAAWGSGRGAVGHHAGAVEFGGQTLLEVLLHFTLDIVGFLNGLSLQRDRMSHEEQQQSC